MLPGVQRKCDIEENPSFFMADVRSLREALEAL